MTLDTGQPKQTKFQAYNPIDHTHTKTNALTSLPVRATVEYMDVILKRNPHFRTERVFIPRRTLTNPKAPSKNNGFDNIHDDYILRVKETLGDVIRYIAQDSV
ncbi:hypothetical protein BD560DRAFT_384144 [Blakeslea trispora]|nr:hypothetical protein BD560DRAFT_384144 [Blakeslea trispora]